MTRRVVVTGVGLVCALGIGTEESWSNLVAGKSGIATITLFDTTGFDCTIGGEIKNFDPFRWIEKKELKNISDAFGKFAPDFMDPKEINREVWFLFNHLRTIADRLTTEFTGCGLADENGARRFGALDGGRIDTGNVLGHRARARRVGHARDRHQVLGGERQTVQRAERLAPHHGVLCRSSSGKRRFRQKHERSPRAGPGIR